MSVTLQSDHRKLDETGGVLFTYRDLLAMEQAGILNSDEHIELLGGKIFKIMIQPPHAFTTTQLGRRFTVTFDPDFLVVQQNPLRLSDDLNDIELPQPDLMLVTQKVYVDHPKPQDVFLLIEVSDSTLKKDRQIKLPLYAIVGIREV
jgi:Uma2 family endonuclease